MKKLFFIIPVFFCAFLLQAQDEKELLLHWSFDDGTATDLSDNGHDGELYNVLSEDISPLSEGKSMYFDGTDSSYIYNKSVIEYLNGLKAFSVSVWVKSDTLETDQGFLICDFPKNRDQYLAIRYDKGGYIAGGTNVIKVGLSLTADGLEDTLEYNMETISDLQTTEWQHILLCWESGDEELTLYIDGEGDLLDPNSLVVKSNMKATDTLLPPDPYLTDMTELYLGKGGKDKESSWKGSIDELVILNFKVTEDEAVGLYNGELPNLEDPSVLRGKKTINSNIRVLPNPLQTSTQIGFSTDKQARITIEIYDACGKFVQIISDKIYEPGAHSINWSPPNTHPGVYFGRMKVNNSVETFKLVVQ